MKLEVLSRAPSGPARSTPLLFVHGAWHGAWCWDEGFLDFFAQRGYSTYAPSLRGHGGSEGRSRLRWARLADYAADVAQVAQTLPAPPVVIGHSMGGGVTQKYLETHPAPAAVLMASVPPAGVLGATLRIAARHPVAFAKVNLTLSLYPLVATPDLAREAFFSDRMPDAEARAYAARMQDESYLGFLDMLAFDLPRPKKVSAPVLVMGGEADRIFSPAEVRATARAYNTEAVLYPGMAHDMMLEPGWQAVAERIAAWLTQRDL